MKETMTAEDREAILNRLVLLSRIDTLYRDQYLGRARLLLQEAMSYETYRGLKRQRINLANLPNQVRNAMSDGDWLKVGELSKEHETLKIELERKEALEAIGKAVYDNDDLPIDPFSPGMNTIPGVTQQSLAELEKQATANLQELCRTDRDRQSFYLQRIESFSRLQVDTGPSSVQLRPSSGEREKEALDALEEGNFSKLARLAEGLNRPLERGPSGKQSDVAPVTGASDSADYCFEFSEETVARAEKMGLDWQHVPSQHHEFAPLCRFAWHPTFAQLQDNHSGVLRVTDLPFPQGTPDALKARVQLFANHPMVNSTGVRFLPTLVEEDVLVETFAEPSSGKDSTHSALLEALGLPQRSQLSRRQIETALLAHEGNILETELGLDPLQFKLICIPPDLHLRLGLERGWGQQKIWTHFDGYLVMMDGSLRPLAGGDVRYGGVYDLLGIPRSYDSDRLIVRFAVVQRLRMALWQ